MRGSLRFGVLAALAVSALWVSHASAFPDVARDTKAACAACHVSPAGGTNLTDAGTAWKTDKKAPDASVAGAEYVGSAKCKFCHMTEYKSWSTTKHAMALQSLTNSPDTTTAKMAAALKVTLAGKPATEAACLKCHVTGYALTGGYPAADSTKNAALAMVSCESCHGPGSLHTKAPKEQKAAMINGHPTAAMCTQCHTPEMSPKFNFDEYAKTGLHDKKAAAPAAK